MKLNKREPAPTPPDPTKLQLRQDGRGRWRDGTLLIVRSIRHVRTCCGQRDAIRLATAMPTGEHQHTGVQAG